MYFHHISFTYTAHRHSNPSTLPPIDIQIQAHCHPSTSHPSSMPVCIGCLSHEPRALSIRGDEGSKLGRQGRVSIYENGNRKTHLLNARNLLQTAITTVFFFFRFAASRIERHHIGFCSLVIFSSNSVMISIMKTTQ